MDDPNRRGRQDDASDQDAANPRYQMSVPTTQGGSSSSATGAATDRYRQAAVNAPPGAPRGMGMPASFGPYYQESPSSSSFSSSNLPATAMTYGQDYGSETRAQGQGYGGYGASMMMYNVSHNTGQTSVYDTQQFAPRQQTTMQMMAPDVASTYFNSEAGPAVAASHGLQQTATGSGASSDVYQQQSSSVNFGGGIQGVGAMQQQSSAGAEAPVPEDYDQRDPALEEKWTSYQRQLSTVFQDVRNVALESACNTLMNLSSWLLTQVADLGLSQDDANLHEERLKLWNDFNYAWLNLLHTQIQVMHSGQPLSRSQTLVPLKMMKRMGDELVRLCDTIERHGLVDYQYGVWEEQIEFALEDCLDLLESREPRSASDDDS